MIRRRQLVLTSVAAMIGADAAWSTPAESKAMYGLIGKMKAQAGQRDALATILVEGTKDMPGCHSYVVALDTADADALWITEVWDNEASHAASLKLPGVQAAIARGRPLIAEFGERFVTTPIGGTGLR